MHPNPGWSSICVEWVTECVSNTCLYMHRSFSCCFSGSCGPKDLGCAPPAARMPHSGTRPATKHLELQEVGDLLDIFVFYSAGVCSIDKK